MKENCKIWLHRLFNSNSTDIWLLVSYLHRYSLPGIQYYLLQILRTKSKHQINSVLPQLIHIYHSSENNFILNAFLIEQGLEAYFLIEKDEHHLREEIIMNNRYRRVHVRCKFKVKITLTNRNYMRYRCPIIPYSRNSTLAIQGLLLMMTSAISSIFDIELANKISNYKNLFKIGFQEKILEGKNRDLNNFLQSYSNSILPSIRFFRELVNISRRLKCLPKSVRQCGLEIELELLNSHLPALIEFIFNEKKLFVNIVSEFSFVLDSAENSPYLVFFECVNNYAMCINNKKHNKLDVIDNTIGSQENSVIENGHNIRDFLVGLKDDSSINEDENVYISDDSIYNKNLKELNELKSASYILNKLYELETMKNYPIEEINETRERIVKNLKNLKSNKLALNLKLTEKIRRIKETSIYNNYEGYEIMCAIVKRGSDIRHEVIALQILNEMKGIFKEERLDVYLRTYKIFLIDRKSACIEAITNADSIHNIKKGYKTIQNYFNSKFNEAEYEKAIERFISSLVGYSLATYFLQVKDRHNGNILIDDFGYMIHVDFGFILGSYPGFYCVERAPFKFSVDYNDIIGSRMADFKSLFHEGFLVLRKNCDRLCRILEVFCDRNYIKSYNKGILDAFRDRFKLGMSDREADKFINGLITWSVNSMGTGLYDSYQYFSHGYMK